MAGGFVNTLELSLAPDLTAAVNVALDEWQSGGKIPEGAYPKTYKVEGIGEDFLPSATDLRVVDWIERAGDRESFLWARQLVKQEGIFAGGSSGSALAGALKYCRKLSGDRLAVVIFPDSGSRYLSKFYDDKWMREFGFLSTEFGETNLSDLAKLGAYLPHREGACEIGDIPVDAGAPINDEQVAPLKLAIRREGMGIGRIGTG